MNTLVSNLSLNETEILQLMFTTIRDAIFVINTRGEYQTANPAAEKMTGYSVAELCTMTVDDLLMPGAGLPAEERQRAWREGRTVETTLRHKDGHPIPVELSITPLPVSDGEPLVVGIARDISAQKKAEERVRTLLNRVQKVLASTMDGAVLADWQGNILDVNPAYCDVLGYTRQELLEMNINDIEAILSPAEREARAQLLAETGKLKFETWHRHKDGTPIQFEASVSIIDTPVGPRVASFLRDITERKKAEAALRESEERFRQLAENIDAVFYMSDPEKSELLYISPAYETIYGRPRQQLFENPRAFVEAIHPDDRPALIATFEAQARGEPIEVEFRVVRPDGSIRHILSRAFPVFDAEGKLYRTAGIAQDITERKTAEDELRALAARHELVLQATLDGYILADGQGQIVEVNPAYCKMSGYTRDELLGSNINALEAQLSPPEIEARIREMMAAGALQFDTKHRRKDGSILPLEVSITIITLDGQPLVAAFVRDQTQRLEAMKLRAQHIEESAAMNAVGRAVSTTLDLQQVAAAAIDSIAQTFGPDLVLIFLREDGNLRLLADGPPDGQYHHQATPLHRIGQCLCGISAYKGKAIYSTDIHADIRCTWEECKRAGMKSFAALPLISGGDIIGVLGLASAEKRDFSERAEFLETIADTIAAGIQNALLYRQIQQYAAELEDRVAERTAELADRATEMERLNQAMLAMLEDLQAANQRSERVTEKLRAANKELETFTHSVSHDLKAPLRGIDGYSRLLLEDYADRLDDDGRKFLHAIRGATRQMNQLIEDLLAYSRLERRATQLERVDLRELTTMVLHEFDDEIQAAGIKIENNVPDWTVSSDPIGMEMALRNYISNAIKFSQNSSNPTIKISGQQAGKGCIISVKDNGIGFDMKFHDRIFGIFQRLHRSEDYPGTGVGLAIVHKAMERLGGRAWAESTPGQGATFYLEIPEVSHDPSPS